MKKPREFFIYEFKDGSILGDTRVLVAKDLEEYHGFHVDNQIQAIEKSAYLDLQARADLLAETLEEIASDQGFKFMALIDYRKWKEGE